MAKNEADLKKDRNQAYDQAVRYWGTAITEMKTDMNFVLGEQWEAEEKVYLKMQRREALVFNKIHRITKIITGFQRKNRLSLKYTPGKTGNAKTTEQFNKLAMQIMAMTDGYNLMSDAFEKGACNTGLNLVGLHMDYEHDLLSGDLKLTRWPYNAFLLDPNVSEFDLSNCGYILLREYVDKNTAKTMVPADRVKEIQELHPTGPDDKFNFLQPSRAADGSHPLRYDQFWYQDSETYEVLVDPQTHNFTVLPLDIDSDQKKLIMQQNPAAKIIKRTRKIVRLTVLVEDHVFYEGNPYGTKSYPFVPVWGFFTPEASKAKLKVMGVTRLVRDPQTEANKRKSKMLDIMDTVISSGWKAKEGSVVDPNSLYISGQGKVVWVKNGYELDDIREILGGKVPEGLFRLNEIFDQDIVQIPGANDDLLGTPDKEDLQIAGVLAKLRQSSGITILQDLFDNYRRSKKLLGTKIIQMLQANYVPQKVVRLIGEQPTPDFYEANFSVYDCVPTEGLLTDTQRQMHFMQLLALKQMGAPIPFSYLVAHAPIDATEELVQMIQQSEQAEAQRGQQMQQFEQAMAQLQMAKSGTEVAVTKENLAQSEQNRAKAILDNVRMLKELQEIDLSKLTELLKVAREIEQAKAAKVTKR